MNLRHVPLVLGVSLCAPAPVMLAQAPAAAAAGPAAVTRGAMAPSAGAAVTPPPPVLPDTISRDDQGRATVRAVRVTAPVRIDGRLDEAIYHTVHPASNFIQMEPRGGQPATEKTEVWVFFDNDNLYVTFRAEETHPERMIANEMRRDSNNIRQGDSVEFALDTFRDRRNAILFEANALGARTDLQSTNERQMNADWNPIWNLAAGRFEGGWIIEAALPFKSIRYAPGTVQDWGFQARRTNKWKNEISYLTRVPPALGLGRADFSASLYANLVGVEAPRTSRTLELKPYTIADLTTDRTATPARINQPHADVGVDAKYALTQNLTADVSYNTDFAQVEADEQQVNLTRFSLFFPEKREFFLENQGLFTFGNNSFAPSAQSASDVPILFYSRRIGLAGNRPVPILAGGRVTGRVGRYSLGVVNMQTQDAPQADARATNFSVVRLKRDILRRSSIGLLGTARSHAQSAPGSNEVYGVDGTFGFFNNLTIATYLARSRSDEVRGDDLSYRAQMEYGGDRYGLQLERLSVDRNFNPGVGFVRRADMRKNFALVRFSPRSRRIKSVRKFSGVAQATYIEDGLGRVATRSLDAEFAVEFQSSDRFSVGVNDDYELILRPFTVVPGARISPGGYDFATARVAYLLGQQRRVSGNVLFERGAFYGGERTALTLNRSRLNLSPRLSVEPSLTLNWLTLPAGAFTNVLTGGRITFTLTPRMFASALVQYNSSTHLSSTNARLRWEYRPGSELFIVVNEERNTAATALVPQLQNRSIVVKVNRFIRF